MQKPLGVILILAGIVLLGFSFTAAESFTSEVSKFFTGEPSDKTIFLAIGSLVALAIGALLVSRGDSPTLM